MNDNDGAKPSHQGLPKDAALSWSITMRGEVTESVQEEFDRWLAASPRHKQAYDRYSRVMAQAEILKSSGRKSGAASVNAASVEFVTRPPKRWLMAGAAAAAVIVLAITISAGGTPFPVSGDALSARAAEPIVTKRGEIRSFILGDGSTATLDSDTRVEVTIDPDTRNVRVARGRARVQVVSDARPFRIVAGEGVVTATEAVVDVILRHDHKVVVELIRGKADLGSAPRATPAAAAPLALRSRKALQYRADDKQVRATAQNSGNSSSDWPSGWAEHRSVSLYQLVSEANRYASIPMIVEDPNIAKREVSGRFKINDTEMFLKRIAGLLDLVIDRRPDGIHLRSQ